MEDCDHRSLGLANNKNKSNPHNEHHQLRQDSISESTEVIIQRNVEGIQKLLNPQYGNTTPDEEAAAVIKINPAIKSHCELEIKTLQEAPRDADKLRALLQIKERQHQKITTHMEDIETLFTEIEMLKFVLFLVRRNHNNIETSAT
jgi:hypothetical protein